MAFRQFNNRVDIPEKFSTEDRYQRGLLDRDQVHDLEYNKALDNEFESGVRISAYSTVKYPFHHNANCNLTHKTNIFNSFEFPGWISFE